MDRFREPDEEVILGYCYYDKELYGGEDGYAVDDDHFVREEDWNQYCKEHLNAVRCNY